MTTATSTRPSVRTWPTLAVLAVVWAAIVASQPWVFGIPVPAVGCLGHLHRPELEKLRIAID